MIFSEPKLLIKFLVSVTRIWCTNPPDWSVLECLLYILDSCAPDTVAMKLGINEERANNARSFIPHWTTYRTNNLSANANYKIVTFLQINYSFSRSST